MKRASVQSYILLTMMALSAVARADDDAFSVELADGVKFSDGIFCARACGVVPLTFS